MGQPQALARDPHVAPKAQLHFVEPQPLGLLQNIIGREEGNPNRKAGKAMCQPLCVCGGGDSRAPPHLTCNLLTHG